MMKKFIFPAFLASAKLIPKKLLQSLSMNSLPP